MNISDQCLDSSNFVTNVDDSSSLSENTKNVFLLLIFIIICFYAIIITIVWFDDYTEYDKIKNYIDNYNYRNKISYSEFIENLIVSFRKLKVQMDLDINLHKNKLKLNNVCEVNDFFIRCEELIDTMNSIRSKMEYGLNEIVSLDIKRKMSQEDIETLWEDEDDDTFSFVSSVSDNEKFIETFNVIIKKFITYMKSEKSTYIHELETKCEEQEKKIRKLEENLKEKFFEIYNENDKMFEKARELYKERIEILTNNVVELNERLVKIQTTQLMLESTGQCQ